MSYQLILFTNATNDKNKYKVVLKNLQTDRTKTINFGAKGMSDYTIHKDEERKQRYIDRHKSNENWDDIETAGAWSRWILWNKPTIKSSLEDMIKRFKIKI